MLMGNTSYPSEGGLAVYVSDRANPLPAERLMIEALTAAGVSYKVYQFKSQDPFDRDVVVLMHLSAVKQ